MSFWRHFLGDYGQDLNIADAQSDIAALHKAADSQVELDQRQDADAAKLRRRVLELEQGLSALLKRLVAKGVLTPADLEEFARAFAAADRNER